MLQVAPIVLGLALQVVQPQPTPSPGLPLTGETAEQFLTTAEVVRVEELTERGVTNPQRVTLSDGTRTHRAVFKTYQESSTVKQLPDRRWPNFRDSYEHEVAAYQLDQMIGLDMVPPCVIRKIGSDTGALCVWVENAMTEVDRIERDIQPPDIDSWNRQVYMLRAFQFLIADMDYKNLNNVLVDSDFKIYKIDSSRAFRSDKGLIDESALNRFSRSMLDGLRRLQQEDVKARLGDWLDKAQIKGLMARRDKILALAGERIAEQGEAAVLVP